MNRTKFKHSSRTAFILFVLVMTSFTVFAQTRNLDSLLSKEELKWLNEHKEIIRYAPDPSFPPIDYIENGEHKGIVSDYFKLFEAMLGIDFNVVYYQTWSDIMNGLKNAEIDIVGCIHPSEDRYEYLLFSKPYIQTKLGIATKANYEHKLDNEHINSMRLACIRDYASTQFVEKTYPDAEIFLVDNDFEALLQTSYGMTDGAVVDPLTASFLVEKYGISNLKHAAYIDFSWDLRFASRKEQPELISIINKLLTSIDEEKHQHIYKRWVNYAILKKPNFFEQHQIIIVTILLFVLFLLFVTSIFGFLLKKQIIKQTDQLKQARETAEHNEERFKLIAENTTDVIWLSDLKLNLNYVSPSIEKMTGYSPEEFIKITFDQRIPKHYHGTLFNFLKEELKQEKDPKLDRNRSKMIETEHYHKDGYTFWMNMNLSFIRDASGKAVGIHGVIRDFTERKKARDYIEKRLDIETLLSKTSRMAIENAPLDSIFNTILKEIGITLKIGRSFIFEFNNENKTLSNTHEWCAKGVASKMDIFRQLPDKESSWFLKKLKQGDHIKYKDIEDIPDESTKQSFRLHGIRSVLIVPLTLNDRFYGFIGFNESKKVRDWLPENVKALESLAYIVMSLLERQNTEKELIKKERSIELSLIGKDFLSLDGNLTYANQTFLNYWGYHNLEEILNKKVTEFWESETESRQVLAAVLENGRWKGERKARRADGTVFDVYYNTSLVTSKSGKPICIQAAIFDITEIKAWEKELILAKEKAEESNRLKSAFLFNISHEIRTPMNGILGFLNVVQDMRLSDEEKKEYLNLVNKSGQRLIETLNDIIEISKIESGELDFHESPTDIAEALDDIKRVYKPLAMEKNLQFSINIDFETGNVQYTTDKMLLRSILSHLVKNAIKFSEKGSIELGGEIAEHLVHFYVKDTGKGIPDDRIEAIFDRFVQADLNLTREHEGAGLGLSIAKAYVEQLGGKIWVKSKTNEGSTFHFTIPFKPIT